MINRTLFTGEWAVVINLAGTIEGDKEVHDTKEALTIAIEAFIESEQLSERLTAALSKSRVGNGVPSDVS